MRTTAAGVDEAESTLFGMAQGGTQQQSNISQYCMVDGCYRNTRSNGYCEKHYLNLRRSGHLRAQKKTAWDWVSDAAGPECRVCGRSVYEHGVTEFCQEIARHVA